MSVEVTDYPENIETLRVASLDGTKNALSTSDGVIVGISVNNPSNAVAFVQIFALASGDVTVGTTAPTFSVAVNTGASHIQFVRVFKCPNAITVAATTGRTNSTNPSSAIDVEFYVQKQ